MCVCVLRERESSADTGFVVPGAQEVAKWANQQLVSGGYDDQLITDLTVDMADGITLLNLVQSLCE